MWMCKLQCYVVWVFYLPFLVQPAKPSGKRQLAVWRLECELGMISDPECPVDGGWTNWTPWSPCQGPCDDVGHRRRTRECINPPPSKDGLTCTGSDEQTEVCYITNCTVEDYRKLVVGDPARTEALHQLEAVPALMERCLQSECPFEAIETALNYDNTWQLNAEVLWNSLQCVKRNLGCPVTGEWGSWGAWSACGSRCGHGVRWRLRRCDMPPPSSAHLTCIGTPLQADDCIGDQCALTSLNSAGTWGEWSEWLPCSEKCGTGVRRRRRICLEAQTTHNFGTWGTHCRGQHDQLEICENNACNQDGEWSGWGPWGPCSQTCGPGRRSRARSCTRPMPSGTGAGCTGLKIETGTCHLAPCIIYPHTVAVLNGESYLNYNFPTKRSRLFHFYIRFMPLSPRGTLVRRGSMQGPHVRLSVQKWHICLDACGLKKACCIPRSCSHDMTELGSWHSALITVTTEGATLRFDDALTPLKSTFSCDPELPDDKMNIYVGERLHGEIQELVLNFIPLNMASNRERRSTRCDFCPTVASNVAFEKGGTDEAYVHLHNGDYLRLPCFNDQDDWLIGLTLKPKTEAGTIIFMKDEATGNWLHLSLQNMRIKLKLAVEEYKSESSSSVEFLPDQWIDVTVSKKQDTSAIETAINEGERLHVLFQEELRGRRDRIILSNNTTTSTNNFTSKKINENYDSHFSFCTDEFFVGGVPQNIKRPVNEDFAHFSGIIAAISLNGALLDLHDYSRERQKNEKIQVSSRTASISGSYHETAWGKSKRLNLTCLHAKTAKTPRHAASWLFLDTSVNSALSDKTVRSVDDGRVLRLVATANNELRGFYTCRAHNNRRPWNIVTYGVMGRSLSKLPGPDFTTALAIFTTLTLVASTLIWLIIEGYHDIRNGFGFFRDAHLPPDKEAEAVCKYIDQNMKLIVSKSAARMAKARARERGRQLASQISFGAQEPQGMLQQDLESGEREDSVEMDRLPELPEGQSSVTDPKYQIYRCEPCYTSSPRHGTLISPRERLTSSSSFEISSPRVLCSKLALSKRLRSSKENLVSRKLRGALSMSHLTRSNMGTIKSSTNVTPALKILQKFRELKYDDL